MIFKKFKFLEHTADLKFQAFGKNQKEVFINSSYALKEIICKKLKIKNRITKNIKIKGNDFESLFYKFLEEIIYLVDAEDFIIKKVKSIELKDFEIKAVFEGDKASNYNFTNNAKASTYNDMFFKKIGKKWIGQAVIDV